jgi:hypothetical protein
MLIIVYLRRIGIRGCLRGRRIGLGVERRRKKK